MKIIIVGGGISGLATYLYLRKLLPNPTSSSLPGHTIHIYESHRPRNKITQNDTQAENQDTSISSLSASTQTVGGGLGISPNGMRVLRDISPSLHEAVTAQGFPCENFIFMGENGWTLGIATAGDKGGYEGPDAREEVCVSSLRGGLWACLKRHVDENYGNGEEVVKYEKVIEVRPASSAEGKKTVVVFEGGREEEADLVIGTDGVKSVVRRALFGDGNFEPVYTYVVLPSFPRGIALTQVMVQRRIRHRRRGPRSPARPSSRQQSHGLHLRARRLLRIRQQRSSVF